jgi:hypothetical protein
MKVKEQRGYSFHELATHAPASVSMTIFSAPEGTRNRDTARPGHVLFANSGCTFGVRQGQIARGGIECGGIECGASRVGASNLSAGSTS